jgi:hypothetical protein
MGAGQSHVVVAAPPPPVPPPPTPTPAPPPLLSGAETLRRMETLKQLECEATVANIDAVLNWWVDEGCHPTVVKPWLGGLLLSFYVDASAPPRLSFGSSRKLLPHVQDACVEHLTRNGFSATIKGTFIDAVPLANVGLAAGYFKARHEKLTSMHDAVLAALHHWQNTLHCHEVCRQFVVGTVSLVFSVAPDRMSATMRFQSAYGEEDIAELRTKLAGFGFVIDAVAAPAVELVVRPVPHCL